MKAALLLMGPGNASLTVVHGKAFTMGPAGLFMACIASMGPAGLFMACIASMGPAGLFMAFTMGPAGLFMACIASMGPAGLFMAFSMGPAGLFIACIASMGPAGLFIACIATMGPAGLFMACIAGSNAYKGAHEPHEGPRPPAHPWGPAAEFACLLHPHVYCGVQRTAPDSPTEALSASSHLVSGGMQGECQLRT